jgi:hypothetical protein
MTIKEFYVGYGVFGDRGLRYKLISAHNAREALAMFKGMKIKYFYIDNITELFGGQSSVVHEIKNDEVVST